MGLVACRGQRNRSVDAVDDGVVLCTFVVGVAATGPPRLVSSLGHFVQPLSAAQPDSVAQIGLEAVPLCSPLSEIVLRIDPEEASAFAE